MSIVPITGVAHEPGESEEVFASRLAADLENTIIAEGPHTVAAFIAEPVMGSGGVIVPPATYFEKVQAVSGNTTCCSWSMR